MPSVARRRSLAAGAPGAPRVGAHPVDTDDETVVLPSGLVVTTVLVVVDIGSRPQVYRFTSWPS